MRWWLWLIETQYFVLQCFWGRWVQIRTTTLFVPDVRRDYNWWRHISCKFAKQHSNLESKQPDGSWMWVIVGLLRKAWMRNCPHLSLHNRGLTFRVFFTAAVKQDDNDVFEDFRAGQGGDRDWWEMRGMLPWHEKKNKKNVQWWSCREIVVFYLVLCSALLIFLIAARLCTYACRDSVCYMCR